MNGKETRRPLRVLVIEGGGMRTSYLCGVLCELACNNIRPENFDLIVVVSAGGISAAYYMSGQTGIGHGVWRRLTGKRFVGQLRNILVGRPIFNLEYLGHVCTEGTTKLNIGKVITSRATLRVVVTDCRTGMPRYIDPTASTLLSTLMTSSAYPPFARPRSFNGSLGCDGAITDPLPVQYAIDQGATDILVLSTTPRHFRQPRVDPLAHLLGWIAFPGNEAMRAAYRRAARRYNRAKRLCTHPPEGVHIVTIEPERLLPSWELDGSEEHLHQTLKQGELDTRAALNRGDIQKLFE